MRKIWTATKSTYAFLRFSLDWIFDIRQTRSYWFRCNQPCSNYCFIHGCLRLTDYRKKQINDELKSAAQKSMKKLLKKRDR